MITRNLGRIYKKLSAGGIAINIETLSPDIVAGAAMAATIIVTPGNNKAAIIQRGHCGTSLSAGNFGVDKELITRNLTT